MVAASFAGGEWWRWLGGENGEGEGAEWGARVAIRARSRARRVAAGRSRAPHGVRALPQAGGENDDRWGPYGLHWSQVGTFSFLFLILLFNNLNLGELHLKSRTFV